MPFGNSDKSLFSQFLDYLNSSSIEERRKQNTRDPDKPACPSKKEAAICKKEESVEDAPMTSPSVAVPESESVQEPSRPCPNKRRYVPPSQFCPPQLHCCYIKMQDPKAPCCRESKDSLPPCPAKKFPKEPRKSVCDCDVCRERGGKCCERNKSRLETVDPRFFQKA